METATSFGHNYFDIIPKINAKVNPKLLTKIDERR